jgi:CDP-glucose 4,6-dehydratase
VEGMVKKPDPAFWKGKRVLVTGHTGFKGSWLVMWLEALGATPLGLSLAPDTTPSLSEQAGLEARFESVRCDIRDGERLGAAVRAFAPDIVLHLAAQTLVRRSYREAIYTFEANVMGTAHLLEAVRATPSIQAVVIVTTDKCYENNEWAWAYREIDPLGGYDPYSASKACAEILVSSWRRSFLSNAAAGGRQIAIGSARAGNVIGGGDWAVDRLVPDCARAFAKGEPVVIRNPNATRPWQHVLEPLSGYLLLAERLWQDGEAFAEAWNFGPEAGDIQPVSWVLERLVREWGEGARWELVAGDHPHEAGLLAVDAAKARARLHWRPRLSLKEALAWTASWYQRARAGEDVAKLVVEQIKTYEMKEVG